MPKDISKRNSIDSLSYCIIEMQKQKDLRLSPMKDTRPVDQSSVSAKVTVENPFGDIQQDTLNITYNEMKGEGKQDKYIENNFKVSSCLTEDEDSDCEFDWNDDPDHIKLKRRKTTKERLQAAIRNPCCWHYLSPLLKRVIIAFLGSCIFVIIAIIIYFALPKPTQAERQNPDFKNIRSNVQCWMYWSAFMWHIFWITTFALDSVPSIVSLWIKIFRGRRSERAKSYMEYYMSLKGYFCIILLAAWNVGSWTFLINIPFPSIKLHSYSSVITKAFRCLLAAAILLFGQKAITEVIALKFHRTAFQDRLVENKKSLKILDTLSKSEKRIRPVSSSVVTNRNSRVRNRRSQKGLKDQQNIDVCREPVKLTDKAIHHLSSFDIFKKGISSIVLAEKPTSDVSGRLEKDKMDINSDDSAKKVAKKLFYSLAFPDGNFLGKDEDIKSKLDIRHFTPYFGKPEEAKEAFDVFDKDGNGNLTRREFRDTVVQIYRERKGLAQAIRDTSQAMGKIDGILLVITCLITLFVSLSIFSVDFWAALIPFGTLLAACTFIFDTSAKALCQGIIFQFVTHPYDSGDLVLIDGSYMFVENIGILGTIFIGADGMKLYAPTVLLQTKIISNVRRSGNMGESLTFNIDFRTNNETILLLRERLSEWVQSQSRDFATGFDMRVSQILDMNQIILVVWLPHKGNWVELGKRFQRKTRFMLALKSILTELNIRYELPAQRITSTSRNSFDISQTLKPQNFNKQEASRSI